MAPLSLPSLPVQAGDRVCVALSGGGDSVALLLLLAEASTRTRAPLGIGLSAVHVHHGLRGPEADHHQAFVESLCSTMDVPLAIERVDTAAYAQVHRQTTEEAARNLRYALFAGLLSSGSANVVVTGHTLEDQSETVLMKLLRGAWLEGLSGIAPVLELEGGRILRPLLSLSREHLRDFLRERNQTWREDSSNADDAFTRNRLRNHILPLLRTENPSFDQTLGNLASIARDEEAHWAAELNRLLPQIVLTGRPVRGGGRANSTAPGDQTLAIELQRLRALDPATRRRIVRAVARQLDVRLNFDETIRLLALAGLAPPEHPAPVGKAATRLRLRGGLVVERSLRELRFSIEPSARPPAPLPAPR